MNLARVDLSFWWKALACYDGQSLHCSLVVGSAYPVYASFSLLESNLSSKEKEQQATQWLTYWAIYGVISAAEQLIESRPPLYFHLKLALLLWLQSSNYQVATAYLIKWETNLGMLCQGGKKRSYK